MKISMEVDLKPFTVPNFVIVNTPPRAKQEGFTEPPKYSLSELDELTLEKLCDEFRKSVFEKAGKNLPPISA